MTADRGDGPGLPAAAWSPPPMDGTERRVAIPWEWYDAVGIYFVWIVLSGAAGFAVNEVVGDDEAALTAGLVLVSLALLLAVTATWVSLRASAADVARGVRRALGPKSPTLRDAAAGVGYGVAAFLVVQLGLGLLIQTVIEALGEEVPAIQEEVQDAVTGSGGLPLLVAFSVAVLAPIGEELLFRGVLYQALAVRLPGWPAIGLSGLAFGLTHVEPFVIVLTFPLGMALAWMLRRHGTLLVPVVAHATFNLIGVAIIRVTG